MYLHHSRCLVQATSYEESDTSNTVIIQLCRDSKEWFELTNLTKRTKFDNDVSLCAYVVITLDVVASALHRIRC